MDISEPDHIGGPPCELSDHFESLSVTPTDSPKLRRSSRLTSKSSSVYATPQRAVSQEASVHSMSPVVRRGRPPKHAAAKKPKKTLKRNIGAKVEALPGRESEFVSIRERIFDSLKMEQGCCICKIYQVEFILDISGVPGTGKTATVRQAIRSLEHYPNLDDFVSVEINGMKLADVSQAYSVLWKRLSRKNLTGTAAMHRLSKYFGSGRHPPVVVILDELDLLLKKRSSILYNFFEWTGWSTAKLIVVAIANTMDLPERFLPNRIASRMGSNRINFKPYTYPQLMAIISHRQSDWQNIFHPDALEYCARKVSAVSGDARRALSLAKRAVDWVKGNLNFSEGKLITIPLMEQAIQMTFAGNSVQVMGDLSTQQKILLLAIMMSTRTSESSSVPFERACECHWQLLRNNNMATISFASLQAIFSQLESVRLASKQDVDMRSPVVASSVIRLCVPEEEVSLALKHEVALQKHLQT